VWGGVPINLWGHKNNEEKGKSDCSTYILFNVFDEIVMTVELLDYLRPGIRYFRKFYGTYRYNGSNHAEKTGEGLKKYYILL
jgi:hypothetical protein